MTPTRRPPPEVEIEGVRFIRRDLAIDVADRSWSLGFRFGLISTACAFVTLSWYLAG